MFPPENFPYRIERKVGEGGMGAVYSAIDPDLNRRVAIKVMHPGAPEMAGESRRRFIQEARAAAALSHPGVTVIHRISEDSGQPYIVMEWLDGETLDVVLKNRAPLPPEEAAQLGLELAEALDAAHQAGVIHRDVKPANLIRLKSGRLKVMDFGIARILGSDLVKTQAGEFLATPMYASPEQLLGKEIDGRSDLFSAGVVLYLALTGRMPFGGRNLAELVSAVFQTEPPPPRSLNRDIPPGLEAVILCALRKEPERRFGSAGEMARAIRPFTSSGSPPSPAEAVDATQARSPFPFADLPGGQSVAGAVSDAPFVANLPSDPRKALLRVVSGWPSRALGRVAIPDLLNRLLEIPLHAEPFSGAVRIGESTYLLLNGGWLLAALNDRAPELPGDEVAESLPALADVTLFHPPAFLSPGVLPLLASLVMERRVRHAELDSSFVNLPALADKLLADRFDGLVLLKRDSSTAWILLERGRTALALYAGAWPEVPLERSWQSWVSDLVLKASVEEPAGSPLFESYRRLFPDQKIAIEEEGAPLETLTENSSTLFTASRRFSAKTTSPPTTRRLVVTQPFSGSATRTGSLSASVSSAALQRDDARRFLTFILNELPGVILERGKTESLKYVESWIPLVKSAVLHHALPRPHERETDFFDLVTFDAEGKALHVASRAARGTSAALSAFIDRVTLAKSARLKTGDIGGAIFFAPAFDDGAAEVFRTATAHEGEKKSWTFGAIEAATHYEGFVRMGARRGFHLLLVSISPEGFKLLLP